MIRVFLLGVVLLQPACVARRSGRYLMADSPEGFACKRECMAMQNQCEGNVRYATINGQLIAVKNRGCQPQFAECMGTCPGACWAEDGQTCTDHEGRTLRAPGQKSQESAQQAN